MKKIIKDFPMYEIYSDGRIWSKHTNKFLKPFLSSQGKGEDYYLAVKLCDNTFEKTVTVHRLVAENFIENPNNFGTVNHRDGNKQNNCIENLEWMTQGDNKRHAFDTGISEAWWKAQKHPRSTFSNEEVNEICKKFEKGVKPIDLAPATSLEYQKLFRIWNRDNWKTISKNYNW